MLPKQLLDRREIAVLRKIADCLLKQKRSRGGCTEAAVRKIIRDCFHITNGHKMEVDEKIDRFRKNDLLMYQEPSPKNNGRYALTADARQILGSRKVSKKAPKKKNL